MKTTELKLGQLWIIVTRGDVNGYHTGKKNIKTELLQFDTPKEMQDCLCDGSVESGESGGDYLFSVIAQHPLPKVLYDWNQEEIEQ